MTDERRLTDTEVSDARTRAPSMLLSLVSKRVKLVKRGRDHWGLCPFHKEGRASFKVDQGGFYKCHGCGEGGDAFKWLAKMEDMAFPQAVRAILGNWVPAGVPMTPPACAPKPIEDREPHIEALAMWDHAIALPGTHAEAYLKAREIRRPASAELRFAPRCAYYPPRDENNKSRPSQIFPALIARVSDDRGFCAIQRIYLDPTEPRKATLPDRWPVKMSKAPMLGGAVRLRAPAEVLGLAEGVETALSVMQLYHVPTWATLGTARLIKGAVQIPARVKSLVIFGDAGEPGRVAAFAAAERYEDIGLPSEVVFPAADFPDLLADDFNTVLQRKAS